MQIKNYQITHGLQEKCLFSTEFFSRKIFCQKILIFPQNLPKEKFSSEIIENRMNFTHGQLFRWKADISNGTDYINRIEIHGKLKFLKIYHEHPSHISQ